ncbi:MAG: alkaline phosphatase D family protein [Ilumatobacteraceae bacterium]|nr:alkaline phosphatase D family protein [Ilumatobacteraceae bacterium]
MFASGVASGDVDATSVVLWTRAHSVGAGPAVVDWELASSDGVVVRSGRVDATSSADHTVRVIVDELEPATDYEFAFTCGDATISGRTRTLPENADRFRFAVACCSRWGWPGFELFDAIADETPDLLLHLGDSIYEIGEMPTEGVATDPPWDCRSLDDYRRRYRQHRSNPSLRRLLADVPMNVVWDDHEVVDNAPDPGETERRRAGQQAWMEWMPTRRMSDTDGLHRRWLIRGLVDLLLVDSRLAGRRPNEVDGPGPEDGAPGSLLDEEQWRSIDGAAATSAAPWFVVANQVQVGPMTLAARPALRWAPWRRVVNPDQWDGYEADRERLYGKLRAAAGRSVVLSGDLHSGWSRTLSDGDGAVAHEFTSPSISGTTYAEAVRDALRLPVPSGLVRRWLQRLNPGIDHLDLDRHGYLVCDVTPNQFVTTFVTADGERHTITLHRDG